MHTSLPPEHDPVSTTAVERLSRSQWQATDRRMAVGCGDVTQRRDGRSFVSIDAWHDPVFDQLATAMVAALPRPLHTLVDEADTDLVSRWERAGFTVRQRIQEYLVPTAALPSGIPNRSGTGRSVPDVETLSGNDIDHSALLELDQRIRSEVDAAGGPPLPVMPEYRSDSAEVFDPAEYLVAVRDNRYVGLIRLPAVIRMPRIALVAVLTAHRRQGIARILLDRALDTLHGNGIHRAIADVDETNAPAAALFAAVGGTARGSVVELVLA